MVNERARRHLLAARSELVRQRAEITEDIVQIEKMLDGRPRSSPPRTASIARTPRDNALEPAREFVESTRRPALKDDKRPLQHRSGLESEAALLKSMHLIGEGVSIEDSIINLLEFFGGPMTTEDIVAMLQVTGSDWESSSIRSQLAKSQASGSIQRLARGLYAPGKARPSAGSEEATPSKGNALPGLIKEGGGGNELQGEDHDDTQR